MKNQAEIDYLEDKHYPCPICERKQEIRISKTNKPYLVCDICGVQLFIRYPAGIKRLATNISGMWI